MKNTNNFYNLYRFLPVGLLLLGISACTTSRPMVGETDGIYYDPANEPEVTYIETIKEKEETYSQPNNKKENLVRIGGKYFDENGNTIYDYESESEYVEDYSNDYFNRQKTNQNNNYATWGDERENLNVSFNYYGSPYYTGFGWNVGYSWGDPFYWGYGYSPFNYWGPYNRLYNYYGYGWGNPYNYWNPYWGNYYGNPFWNGYYGNPYYGGGGYYDPYVYYNGRSVQRAQRGKGMNSNVTINRGSTNSTSQRMERIRRRGNINDQSISNTKRYRDNNNSNTRYNRSSRSSDYGTRSGQRVRPQSSSSRSNNSRSYSSPQRSSSSSNWGSSSRSSSRSSGWSGSSSSRGSSGSSGSRIRR